MTGKTNVGCRRLMLRSRDTMRSNLTDASDLKNIYLGCLKRGERLPVSFAIGSHPLDYLAATCKMPVDEFGAGRHACAASRCRWCAASPTACWCRPTPRWSSRAISTSTATARWKAPTASSTASTGRCTSTRCSTSPRSACARDVLHQTVLHSGRYLSRTDSGNLASLHTEVAIWRALRAIRIEPIAVYVVPASNGRPHARVAIKQTAPGQARAAISALFALVQVKAAFIVDDDVDVFDNEEMEWAMATRFRADRDVVVASGLPGFYADPGVDANRTVAKIGFDLTRPMNQPDTIENRRAFPRRIGDAAGAPSERAAGAGEAARSISRRSWTLLGSKDGREVALAARRTARAGHPVAARRRPVDAERRTPRG